MPRRAPPDPFWWILGHHAAADVWLPLYNFKADKRHVAKGTLGLLLAADEDSKIAEDHRDFDDFMLRPPEGEDSD